MTELWLYHVSRTCLPASELLFYLTRYHNTHVIANLTGAMAKRYVCEGCNKGCKYGVVHTWEPTCTDCMLSPPYISAGLRIPCDIWNRHFRSQTCFDNHKSKTQGKIKKSQSELRKCCGSATRWSHISSTNATNGSVSHVTRTKRSVIFALCIR